MDVVQNVLGLQLADNNQNAPIPPNTDIIHSTPGIPLGGFEDGLSVTLPIIQREADEAESTEPKKNISGPNSFSTIEFISEPVPDTTKNDLPVTQPEVM